MKLTQEQIKGRLKQKSNNEGSDARLLIVYYMMERFLERLSLSKYKDNFVLKGGFLITSLLGTGMRSTMDVDASISGFDLNETNAREIIEKIISVNVDDGITIVVKDLSQIMSTMDYPGIRISLEASIGKIKVPFNIDLSTGNNIFPTAVDYGHQLLIENRKINIWAYPIERVLAEKLQTIISRGISNTRTRDFYDVYVLFNLYQNEIDKNKLKEIALSTIKERDSESAFFSAFETINKLEASTELKQRWNDYKNYFPYANNIEYSSTINSIRSLIELIKN